MSRLNNKQLGTQGEMWALDYLLARQYHFLEKNYRIKAGEIDLIVENQEWVVFVEVKTRRSLSYGRGLESVTALKQQKIRRIAEFYLLQHQQQTKRIRFDVVDIEVDANYKLLHLEHFLNAF